MHPHLALHSPLRSSRETGSHYQRQRPQRRQKGSKPHAQRSRKQVHNAHAQYRQGKQSVGSMEAQPRQSKQGQQYKRLAYVVPQPKQGQHVRTGLKVVANVTCISRFTDEGLIPETGSNARINQIWRQQNKCGTIIMETTAKKIRAYALVQTLEHAFRDLMTLWGDAGGDELDQMLNPNFPFNQSFDDQWASVRNWLDQMPDPHAPVQEPENTGNFYAFVNGLYYGEFERADDAALKVCEVLGIDPNEMKNSDCRDWATWLYDQAPKNSHEIVHEADYRFAQGDNHPANRMELKEFWNEFEDGLFVCCDDKTYRGKYRPSIRWNGWACPYFTRETAEAILRDIPDSTYRYDESRDMLILQYMNDEPQEWEGLLFDGVTMYAIGSHDWTWEAVKDTHTPEEPEMDYKAKFPNGFTSWIETHHEIVKAIAACTHMSGTAANKRLEAQGTGGLWEMGEELTDLFEQKYHDEELEDGEFLDIMDDFIHHYIHTGKQEMEARHRLADEA